MMIRPSGDVPMHYKGCTYLVVDGKVDTWCDCKNNMIPGGTDMLVLNKEDDVVYVIAPNGRIGAISAAPMTFFFWRLNALRIRDIKNWTGEDLAVAMFLSALGFLICFGAFVIIKVASSDGKVDYCRVEHCEHSNMFTGPMYEVDGHRSWRGDVSLYITKDRDEAVQKMAEICPK